MRGAAALAAAACWLSGCGDPVPPDPRIISIQPNTMLSSDAAEVVIRIDAVLPYTVDYENNTFTVLPSLLVNVGRAAVGSGRYERDGILHGIVPSELQPGAHPVTVTLIDGRSGILPGAFTVTPGDWPANGFTIDPIPNPQAANVAFPVTIHAQGAFASTFTGTVDYSLEGVSTAWTTTGKFIMGSRTENVRYTAPTRGLTRINVVDLLGRIAVSNDFTVN